MMYYLCTEQLKDQCFSTVTIVHLPGALNSLNEVRAGGSHHCLCDSLPRTATQIGPYKFGRYDFHH